MRAVVLDHFGGLDSLVIKEIPEPKPEPGKVVAKQPIGTNRHRVHDNLDWLSDVITW